ncbi:MAG: GNAT family N-acetyltransferase [Bacteroidetes bacterium]|nr:GNAT family N-acetyltransferase [Bacteroidota bacterium]
MQIRAATKADLPQIIALLAQDDLGKTREEFTSPIVQSYLDAFQRIQADSNQDLMVAVEDENSVVGTFQLSFIPYLTYQGGIRAQIEAVRVRADKRGEGLGKKLFQWALERAQAKGAHLIQLTTDKKRPEALKFYLALGFSASHEGLKLHFK